MMKRLTGSILALLLIFADPLDILAEESANNGALKLVLENDMFYNLDRHYTNGLRLAHVPGPGASPPKWPVRIANLLPFFPDRGEIRHGYALGQSMFTPSDLTKKDPPKTERPYAGWLYLAVGLAVETGGALDQVGISIGMIGPASLAEESQKLVHGIVSSDQPKGWDTQLNNEPGLVITHQRSWRGFAATTLAGRRLDFTPHFGGAAGNVFTFLNLGGTIRYGRQLPDDYGPPRIQPGLPGSGAFSPLIDFGWYLFAGVEGRAVAHNIFLDGNTFSDSRSVEKYPLVGDFQFGLVLDWSAYRLSYTHILRSKEFRAQSSNDNFGSLSLSFRY